MLARFEPVLRERGAVAYRELFWEAGMIGQALYLAAEAAGIRGTGIGCYFDDVLHRALGLDGHDWESLYHFTVGVPVEDLRLRTVPPLEQRARWPQGARLDAAGFHVGLARLYLPEKWTQDLERCRARAPRLPIGRFPGTGVPLGVAKFAHLSDSEQRPPAATQVILSVKESIR